MKTSSTPGFTWWPDSKIKIFLSFQCIGSKIGHNPSLLWCSLSFSIDLVKESLFWRIGNDQTTRIWEDKWLPLPTTFHVQSPTQLLPRNAKVQALVDPITRLWNRSLIYQIFTSEEASTICRVPISTHGQQIKSSGGQQKMAHFLLNWLTI